ncbi:putative 6-phosphogluconolactonase 4, chloroplastic [Apostasia shenzhenica]|uniref:Putative 6-phosphogluconolactonase 4, chloroplastic n=1 Tax=Apostasia shenzhenica TaxID=1088818 RepID=A0A2H9ZZ37_9ASPA|nr:putative 6-phosphogluconolactonase 4, chloroplastic [Apostasia shenzhenica]
MAMVEMMMAMIFLAMVGLGSARVIATQQSRQNEFMVAAESLQPKAEIMKTDNNEVPSENQKLMTMKPNMKIFKTEEKLASRLVEHVAALSEEYSTRKGTFTIALSGANLIRNLRNLRSEPHVRSVDWSTWHVFFADEGVQTKMNGGNYETANDVLLSKVPIPESQIHPINGSLDAKKAAGDYHRILKQLIVKGMLDVSPTTMAPRFDLMLLETGGDGHLAALFPGHKLLNETLCVASLDDAPTPPRSRVTFTFPVIDAAANLVIADLGAPEAAAAAQSKAKGSLDSLRPAKMVKLESGEFTQYLVR